MKRILFLLLLTVSVYGQNPSRFAKIQITGNTNSGTATKVNVQEANGELNTQTINTAFNKNFGLNSGDVVGADNLLNQYSTVPSNWVAQTYTLGSVVFYGGKQWIAKMATVASDVPNSSSKWEEITFDAIKNDLDSKAPISSVHNPVTIGTANGLSLSTQQLSLGLASSGVTGALSGTDWNTFNGKANANGSNASGTWNISISGYAPTLGLQSVTDANEFRGAGLRVFSHTSGSVNFPFLAGIAIEAVRTGGSASANGSFQIYSGNDSNEFLLFRKVTSYTTQLNWSSWFRILSLNSSNRLLLGTTTDNGTDIAQFNGSAIATAWKTSGGASTDYVTGTGSLINFNSGVRTATLTGFTSGAGTVSASDTVLQAIQKLNGNDALKAPLASPTLTGTPTAPTAPAGTNTTQVATTAFVTGAVATAARPYKVYTATISQTGTSAPTITVLENTLGVTVTPSRSAVGSYVLTFSGTVTGNAYAEIHAFGVSSGQTPPTRYGISGGNTNITISSSLFNGGLLVFENTDSLLSGASIEVRYY